METKHCSFSRCREPRKMLISAKYDDVRTESIHCSKHACRTFEGYPNAVACRRVARSGARYCDIHPSCTLEKCNDQRSPTKSFCPRHTCAVENCRNPASSPNRRCEIHMPCPVQGCPGFRHKQPDGQGWYPACSIHIRKQCGFASCPAKVGLTDTYCAGHICTVRGCPEQRVSDGSNCLNHTCAVNKCPMPVAYPHQVRPGHRVRAYCLFHGCNTRGCHAAAVVEQGHCQTHGCKVKGCSKAKSPDEYLDGYCFSHMSLNMYKKAEKAGRDAEFNDAIRRKEKEMDEQLRREKLQKEREDRMRLEEKIESLERENQKLRAENASVADHDTTDQYSHWDSEESPRSGSYFFDSRYHGFSHQQRTGGDYTRNTPRRQFPDDDSDTALEESIDDIPARSRPIAPYRIVFRRGRNERDQRHEHEEPIRPGEEIENSNLEDNRFQTENSDADSGSTNNIPA